jgi:hypothetical protein
LDLADPSVVKILNCLNLPEGIDSKALERFVEHNQTKLKNINANERNDMNIQCKALRDEGKGGDTLATINQFAVYDTKKNQYLCKNEDLDDAIAEYQLLITSALLEKQRRAFLPINRVLQALNNRFAVQSVLPTTSRGYNPAVMKRKFVSSSEASSEKSVVEAFDEDEVYLKKTKSNNDDDTIVRLNSLNTATEQHSDDESNFPKYPITNNESNYPKYNDKEKEKEITKKSGSFFGNLFGGSK